MPKFVIERLARCFRSSPSSSRRSRPLVVALDPPIGPGIQKTRPSVIELHRYDRRAAWQRRGDAFWMEIGQGAYSIEVAPAQIKVMSIGIWGAVILTTVRFIQGHGIGGE
jgi:hypothetical protein